jgi:NADPH:quinone reductase-like Zn-dependent oxidoreductase
MMLTLSRLAHALWVIPWLSIIGRGIDGTMTEDMTLPEQGVALAPTYLNDVEAACLPTAAVSSFASFGYGGPDQAR